MVRKPQRLLYLKIMEMPAYLELQKQRFYCKSCDSHFTAKSNIVDAHCFISNKTKLVEVLDKAQEYRSQKSIAKSCLVSSMTVSRVINQARDVGQSSFDALPTLNDGRI